MVMGKCKASLYSLPYDLLYQIVTELDCIDYIHLSRTNRTLYSLLQNELLAKRSIENSVREAKEARQAYAGNISFREAIGRIYDTKQAVAYADPYCVAVLAYASTFLYQDGVLSYYCANEIRILNVHQAAHTEQVLDVRSVFRRIIPAFREDEAQGVSIELSLLYYAAGVLAVLAEIGDTNPWLILLDVRPHGPACNRGRLRFRRQLSCTRRLFVRHNHSHLFYGVYSAVGLSSDPQWSVQWVDLTKNTHELETGPILLDRFAGTDIGQNVCFEIFDNHLYAVTSALDSNEEQLHPESFYEWTCISPASCIRRAQIQRIFRRWHTEGPINDTWSEISLRLDEATGRPMITECRREWLQNRTDNVRTYYTEPLKRPSELSAETAEDKFARITREAEQPTTPRVTPLISAASSHYPHITGGAGPSDMTIPEQPPAVPIKTLDGKVIRPIKYKHTEYPDSTMPKRDFILARTKYRAYNPSAAAFVDLINDPEPSTSVGVVQDRLRLRICSRKRKQPMEDKDASPAKKQKQNETLETSDSEEQQYVSNGVKLWPADDADQDLLDLLCPAKRAANVHGASDERTLIYSVDIGTDEPHQQAIILVGFDPRIRLPCMRSRKRKSDRSLLVGTKHNRRVGIVLPRLGDIKDPSKVLVESSQRSPPRPRAVRTERAMHLAINRGYWFDRGQSCTENIAQ